MDSNTRWYDRAGKGAPDNYVTIRKVTYSWLNLPEWIRDIFAKKDYSDKYGSIYLEPHAAVPTLICCIDAGFYFDVSVIGGNEKTLLGALPHDRFYCAAEAIAAFYGIPVRLVLHMADHWFLAALRMADWRFARTYFTAVRVFGYGFHSLFSKDSK